jgi:glycosyltransferase involved in cell wall biosynthesis
VPDISVYIPAYNVARFLPRSIESLLAQTLSPAEILVIDDGSRDNSAELAARYPAVRLIRHERNRGLAAARNTAFRAARSELVGSLDADCIAAPDWLANLAPHLGDREIAGVGGSLAEGVRFRSPTAGGARTCRRSGGRPRSQSQIPLRLQQSFPQVRGARSGRVR